MNITNSKKTCLSLLAVFITIPHMHAAIKQDEIKQFIQSLQKQKISFLDTIVEEAKRQLDQTAIILASLAGMISNNQVPTVKNKPTVLKNIKEMSMMLQQLQREKFVNVDIADAYDVLIFNNAVMNHLLKALEKGFYYLPPFDPITLLTRSQNKNPSAQDIQQALIKNKKTLETLTKKADHAGLRWYNHAYRTLSKHIIEPCAKYSIPRRGFTALATASAAVLAWRYLNYDTFKTNLPWLSEKLGPVPGFKYDEVLDKNEKVKFKATSNYDSLTHFGKLEYHMAEFSRGLLPITSIIGLAAYNGLLDEWTNPYYGLQEKVRKKLTEWNNRLKGGAYLQEAERIAQHIDDVTFDDLVGLNHVKEEFARLRDYLANPEPADRLGITPPKGILLVGETRTGKSFSVKALFGEIGSMLKSQGRNKEFRFVELNASLINKEGIGYLLSLVKKAAPCVVFIDEIDLLDLQRKGKNETLSEFLTCMSGTLDSKDPKNQVIIIAATNRPENLDVALRQPGRFGKELRFEYPTTKDRKKYLLQKLDKISLSPQAFNIEKLVQDTENKSYEALNILINNAVFKARISGEMITQKHIEQTLDEELRHIIVSDTKNIPEHEKKVLAAHLAGHALAILLLDMHTKLSKVTIKQVMTDIKEEAMGFHLWHKDSDDEKQKRFEYGKVFIYHNNDTINISTREETLALCKFNLAGIMAEEMLIGSCSYSCHSEDKQRAQQLAQSLAFEGLDSRQVPKQIYNERYNKALQIVKTCEQEIRQLLSQHKPALHALEQALKEKETLSAQEVRAIVDSIENPSATDTPDASFADEPATV